MKTILLLTSLFFFFSCDLGGSKRRSSRSSIATTANLRIAVDTGFKKYLDYPSIQIDCRDSIYYDSIHHQTISYFKNLPVGNINLQIFSLLTNDMVQNINLQKDTVVYFDTSLYAGFTAGTDLQNFTDEAEKKPDSIFIGQKIVGCFGGSIEKIVIAQSPEGYNILYSQKSDKEFNQQLKLPHNLFNKYYSDFLLKSKKIFPKKNSPYWPVHWSTTSIYTYIRQGKNIVEFPDLFNWNGYENFKKDLGIINVQQK